MANRIKELRKAKDITLLEIANRLGVSEATVQRYESGKIKKLKYETMSALANMLDVSPEYLMGWADEDREEKVGIRSGIIPVLSEIPCGTSTKVYANITDDVVEIEESLAQTGEYYGLRAKGDSMLPKIEPGDIMIIHAQNDVESGQVAIIKVGGEVTCKRVKKYRDGIELIGINPSYAPTFFTKEQIKEEPVEIVGRVTEVRTKL